jgi:hypothetical protein
MNRRSRSTPGRASGLARTRRLQAASGPCSLVPVALVLIVVIAACGGPAGPMSTPSPTAVSGLTAGPTAGVPSAPSPMPTPAHGTFSVTGAPVRGYYPDVAVLLRDGRVLALTNTNDFTEVYDPTKGAFTPTGSMTIGRVGTTATVLANGKVLVVGNPYPPAGAEPGWDSSDTGADLYDPATGTFARTGPLDTVRGGQTATLLADGRVLVAGGWGLVPAEQYPVYYASAEIYDPGAGTFSLTGSMHTARSGATATLLPDGRVLIAGGVPGPATAAVSSAEIYDPTTGTFSQTGSMSVERNSHTATLLPDGRVLVAGGWNPRQMAALASAEIYSPTTGTFSPTGSMATARQEHTATLLKDGRVLVAGGSDDEYSTGAVSSAEVYDPATGGFTPTGPMTTWRLGQTATLLGDGRVLVSGGEWIGETPATADLYWPQESAAKGVATANVTRCAGRGAARRSLRTVLRRWS